MVPAIIVAEKGSKMKPIFNAAIACCWWSRSAFTSKAAPGAWPLAILLTLFFVAFNVLRRPSRRGFQDRPPTQRARRWRYNTCSPSACFGGALAAWLAQNVGLGAVSLLGWWAGAAWLILARAYLRPGPAVAAGASPPQPNFSGERHMASVNKVILIGNLGKDPETRYAPAATRSATSRWPPPTLARQQRPAARSARATE